MNHEAVIDQIIKQYNVSIISNYIIQSIEVSNNLNLELARKDNVLKLWHFLRKEIYLLVCTNNKKYNKERALLNHTAAPIITVMSNLIVDKFGLAIGTASGLAAVALLIPLRLSMNTWCEAYKNNSEELFKLEINELKNISK